MENNEILEEIKALLIVLIEKTENTNNILQKGIKTQWGHNMPTIELDPDRFKKSEAIREKTAH